MEQIIKYLSEKYNTLLNDWHINTPLRRAHFFTQLYVESKCKSVRENMNYSASSLAETWPARYAAKNTKGQYIRVKGRLTPNELALKLHRKPVEIANNVYTNRMGNGSPSSMDGWIFRGGGAKQITGRNNYALLTKDTGIDFLSNPDIILEEANSMIAACWFWKTNKLNVHADKNDLVAVRKTVNGGTIGLDDCQRIFPAIHKIFVK